MRPTPKTPEPTENLYSRILLDAQQRRETHQERLAAQVARIERKAAHGRG